MGVNKFRSARTAVVSILFVGVAALAAAAGYWAGFRAVSGVEESPMLKTVVHVASPQRIQMPISEPARSGQPTATQPIVPQSPSGERPVAVKSEASLPIETNRAEVARRPAFSLDEIRKTDPEKYQRILGHIRASNRRRTEEQRGKYDFLTGIDVSMFRSEQALDVHERLLAKIEELDALWSSNDDWYAQEHTPKEREERLRREWDAKCTLNELYQQERRNLLEATAAELGMQDDDVRSFADAIQEIYESTDGRMWMPPSPQQRERRSSSGSGPSGEKER